MAYKFMLKNRVRAESVVTSDSSPSTITSSPSAASSSEPAPALLLKRSLLQSEVDASQDCAPVAKRQCTGAAPFQGSTMDARPTSEAVMAMPVAPEPRPQVATAVYITAFADAALTPFEPRRDADGPWLLLPQPEPMPVPQPEPHAGQPLPQNEPQAKEKSQPSSADDCTEDGYDNNHMSTSSNSTSNSLDLHKQSSISTELEPEEDGKWQQAHTVELSPLSRHRDLSMTMDC